MDKGHLRLFRGRSGLAVRVQYPSSYCQHSRMGYLDTNPIPIHDSLGDLGRDQQMKYILVIICAQISCEHDFVAIEKHATLKTCEQYAQEQYKEDKTSWICIYDQTEGWE